VSKFTPSQRVSKVEATDDTLTGRGGLVLFCRYLESIGIYQLLVDSFGGQRISSKGVPIWKLFKQVFCFFLDGTSRHLVRFDQLKNDGGYAGAIEETLEEMASSHAVKRFFKSFRWIAGRLFREILHRLFIWRLQIEQPSVIELTIDTMVMDNDEALKRHAVQPTYKKVKGFQPLQIIWNTRVVDAIFRGGKKSGNHAETAVNMVRNLVEYIRKHYRPDVTIILRTDAGFYDGDNFEAFDAMGIGFIATGKMYDGVKEQASGADERYWSQSDNGRQAWGYLEFGYRGDSWKRFWRAFYTRPLYEGEQRLLDFARPDNVILTNLGVNPEALNHLSRSQRERCLEPENIIASHHMRGADELPHRGLKDFGFEQLPFKRFGPNSALYYCMLIGFFLFETYKQDVLSEVIPISSYATTVRRIAVDFAAKIVKTGGRVCLKVPRTIMQALKFDVLWERCHNSVPIRS